MAWFVTIAPAADDGRRLAPLPGVPQHLVQAQARRAAAPSLGELQPIRSTASRSTSRRSTSSTRTPPLGVGKVEDFTWKGLLDFSTCTECGRCQSPVPGLEHRQAAVAQAARHEPARPRLRARRRGCWPAGRPRTAAVERRCRDARRRPQAERAARRRHRSTRRDPLGAGGVIDPDVLWCCTTCGACVEQCPVDIEHVDHIVDMRRYQVLIESAFPSELGGLFKNLEQQRATRGA